jgi:hypothetical protein
LKGNNSGSFLVHSSIKTGLAFHDNVRDTHLAAEGGKKDDELNSVDIVGNDNNSCFLGLDESYDVVQAVLDETGLILLQPK